MPEMHALVHMSLKSFARFGQHFAALNHIHHVNSA